MKKLIVIPTQPLSGLCHFDIFYPGKILKRSIEDILKEHTDKIYNIGNSSPVQLMEYIQAIEKNLGKKR